MAGTLSSRSRSAGADYIWPGYVDALTTLLMVLIFLLSILSVAQFSLSTALSTKDSAIDTLGKQISTLVEQLSLAKQTADKLQADLTTATLSLGQARTERDSLKRSEEKLAAAAKAAVDKTAALQAEIDR